MRACKVVDVSPGADVDIKTLQKEVKVHKLLTGPTDVRRDGEWSRYILDFYEAQLIKGQPNVVSGLYMLMELALGGDLFDKIEPDVGVSAPIAQFYFQQLLSGLEFMHARGICHRDLKPENLLCTGSGDLKISDFGLCAVYKHQGQTRQLTGRVGSLPYVAPELGGATAYDAEPVDVWGAGVVLFTLLAGSKSSVTLVNPNSLTPLVDTPWDEPSDQSVEYEYYERRDENGRRLLLSYAPWKDMDPTALDLLVRLLETDPKERFTIKQAKSHRWMITPSQINGTQVGEELERRLQQSGASQIANPYIPNATFSQALRSTASGPPATAFMRSTGVSSTFNGTAVTDPTITRMRLRLTPAETQELMARVLGDMADSKRVQHVVRSDGFEVGLKDSRKQPLQGRITIAFDQVYDGMTMVSLKRWKGDPLEWRRFWWHVVQHKLLKGTLVLGS